MTTWWTDPTVSGVGTGARTDPYRSTASIVPGAGDVIALKCGATYREQIPAASIAANSLRIVSYGNGALPIVTGGEIIPAGSWTLTAEAGVYLYQLPGNTGGNVTESGIPMTNVLWVTNLATTAPLIPVGGFSYDYTNGRVYIRPTLTIGAAEYEVAARKYCILSTSAYAGLEIEGINFIRASYNAIQLQNRTSVDFHDNEMFSVGGNNAGSAYIGNGIELSAGAHGARVYRNTFRDIFDSPITWQLYDSSVSITDGEAHHNLIERCGFYGIEITHTGSALTGSTISDIEVYENDIRYAGYYLGRPTTVTGRGIHVGNPYAACETSRILIRDNRLTQCRWGLSTNLRDCVSTGVVFRGNVAATSQSPSNGRGIFANGNTLFEANVIDGYNYSVGVYGSSAGTFTPTLHNNAFLNAVESIVSDVGAPGTTTLTGRNNVWFQSGQMFRQFGSGVLFDLDYEAVKAGTSLTGITIGSNSTRPTDVMLGADYRPRVGSPVLSAGTKLSGYRRDADGKQRPNPPSQGAYDTARLRARL
ncbi:MAG: hypothetical protein V4792_10035 [Pseudomonadota bacterium]